VVDGQADVEGLGEQRDRLQPASAPGQHSGHGVREHDVVVGGEIGELGELGVEVGAAHDEAGDLRQVGEHAGQERGADGREGEQCDLAARMITELVPQCGRAFERDRDLGRAAGECMARARQDESPAAALRERHPGLALEHLQLLRHRRRRSGGGRGDGGHAAAFGEFSQQVETANIHVGTLQDQ
jgi:hypothetical protein